MSLLIFGITAAAVKTCGSILTTHVRFRTLSFSSCYHVVLSKSSLLGLSSYLHTLFNTYIKSE